jgi:glycosyltransferase involved in cell wall biosynthesis
MHRILHIVPSLARSGTTAQLALLLAGLPRNEFEAHVTALDCGGSAAEDFRRLGIEPKIIGRRWKADPIAWWRLRRHLAELRPQLVQTWQFEANSYGRIAALSIGTGSMVATERAVDTWKSDLEFIIDRRLAKRTDRIVVDSVAVREFYVAQGLPAEKLTIIRSGVTVPTTVKSDDRAQLLSELGLSPDAKLIAYIGPITQRKRLKELVWATDQLKAVNISAHLLMIGAGPDRQALQRYRWLNRVDERVHFLGARDDVPWLLANVDVLWQSSATEGHSNAILEAMAAGIPVVAADAAGNRELVVPGETGYLVSTDERAGFARGTLSLLENPALARQFGAAGQQRVAALHRPEEMIARYAALYRELLT